MTSGSLVAILILAAVIGAGSFAGIAAAHLMPVQASSEAVLIDHAFDGMLRLTVPIFALVIAMTLVAVIRFRAKAGDGDGPATHGSAGGLVETAWILGSLVLTLGLAAFGAREVRLIRGDEKADLTVEIKASQWSWEFYYPAAKKASVALLLPRGKRVRLSMKSEDVVHSFWVPEFRVKQDLLPDRVTTLYLTPTVVGAYHLTCAELCGHDHTIMTADVRVLEPAEFDRALKAEW